MPAGRQPVLLPFPAARTGRTGRKVTVNVPGGPLLIEWRDDDHVMKTGPAEWEFSGTFDPATGEWSRDTQGLQGSGNADRGLPDVCGNRHLRMPPQHL